MATKHADHARRAFGKEYEALSRRQQDIVDHVARHAVISREINDELDKTRSTFGARLADRIAAVGGSWAFIIVFMLVLAVWVAINSVLLGRKAFDPYPFILLNLFLSMVASLQAPVILMSQNRAATMDRLNAAHDYEVNLKAELEIQSLHAKMDELQQERWKELVGMQQRQIELLQQLTATRKA